MKRLSYCWDGIRVYMKRLRYCGDGIRGYVKRLRNCGNGIRGCGNVLGTVAVGMVLEAT